MHAARGEGGDGAEEQKKSRKVADDDCKASHVGTFRSTIASKMGATPPQSPPFQNFQFALSRTCE